MCFREPRGSGSPLASWAVARRVVRSLQRQQSKSLARLSKLRVGQLRVARLLSWAEQVRVRREVRLPPSRSASVAAEQGPGGRSEDEYQLVERGEHCWLPVRLLQEYVERVRVDGGARAALRCVVSEFGAADGSREAKPRVERCGFGRRVSSGVSLVEPSSQLCEGGLCSRTHDLDE